MIFPGDAVIKNAIELGLEDIRKNPWLIDDVLSFFVKDPYLASKGEQEIANAKEWFSKNKIEVLLKYRVDKDQFPCVTISLGSSVEREDMKHLADLSPCVETLMPNTIGKPIPYIVKPFTPEGFDELNSVLIVSESIDLSLVSKGMVLVNPETSTGYVISDIVANGIKIQSDEPPSGSQFGIIPQYRFYKARREHTFFQETYQIGCHVHGDPAPLLWLHAIVLYCVLRYREALLEGKNFSESKVSSTDMIADNSMGGTAGDIIYSRFINLSGLVENSWLKTPYRVIESVQLKQKDGIKTGIKIISNLDTPSFLDNEDAPWLTVKE